MSAVDADGPAPRVRPSLFWFLLEPLVSLVECRGGLAGPAHRAGVRLPDARSSTSWSVRGVQRQPCPRPPGQDAGPTRE